MLVLTRKAGESIVLPELGVTITVVDCRGSQVRLGFTAPSSVKVFREELCQDSCLEPSDMPACKRK
jgi:carbon storage regulator